ncbi:MAG TPA: PVC-type heme-binding CxxCH protein [Gemmataceae bacterium]|nr:PVC-type heme-binding CxxCH protein [Gemmataceae bacterium]
MPLAALFLVSRLQSKVRGLALLLLTAWLLTGNACVAPAQKPRPPHGQDHMPGPALSPAEAIKKMTVPDGFSVELVASEPDIVNPVAMTFDERGRIWITESLEYPRRAAGPGRDRIKILEDTDGDGKADKLTIFAEGLNIPSGIAVGHGGVWVANAPDILFYKIGPDGKAGGKPEVVVTGFGRTDTHELPNSLTWGPDGWLYGLNGVFNHSHVKQGGKDFVFTCALFRIHPKTREFQLFCEGTSNPWGIAWDTQGSAFVSACVIDHLWHLTETGYYHRQGGPYPPFTWPLGSIVKHRHQKAAYCGIHFFDSDAYPPEYREKLYMGNIHGNCINCDELTRDGSTYFAKPRPDFLSANDAWFMPVSQKTGPDGCLYVLDWYDRYHCYQDANRDPAGIDRLHGRLYRLRYKNTPRAPKFDLTKETDEQLIERLHSPNVFFRDMAQRILGERNKAETRSKLEKLVFDDKAPRKTRMHALWSLIGMGPLDTAFHERLLLHPDVSYRAWAVRAAGNQGKVEERIRTRVIALANDPSPDVLLQVAIAARKMQRSPVDVLLEVLKHCGEDKLIPSIVWQNLYPLLDKEDESNQFLARINYFHLAKWPGLLRLLPRFAEFSLARHKGEHAISTVDSLIRCLSREPFSHPQARQCLALTTNKLQTGGWNAKEIGWARQELLPTLRLILKDQQAALLRTDVAVLGAVLKDPDCLAIVRTVLKSQREEESMRLKAVEALIAVRDPGVLDAAASVLADAKHESRCFRGALIAALGRLDDKRVSAIILAAYPTMEPDLQPKAIELLTQRTAWGKQLLQAIADKKIPSAAVNVNQVRKLLGGKDAELGKQVKTIWGSVRQGRNPEREKLVKDMRDFLRKNRGEARAGVVVFKNLCGQCHKIHGEGVEVGPDLTGNGRASFEQLISNVFDPSLVIGAAYQATTVETRKGRTLTGLVVEDSKQRVVLKLQGGKLETIPRSDIEEIIVSPVSLMPEGIEKQLKPKEIADLFAFLALDKPPDNPSARYIPGTPWK